MDNLLKKYVFEPKEEFGYKELGELARLESGFRGKKLSGKEIVRLCELKKILELTLFKKKPEEIRAFWKNNEQEFFDKFGRAKRKESEEGLHAMKSGISNEIIAAKLLNKIAGLPVKITTPEIDLNNQIDLLCFLGGKVVLVIQVKSKSQSAMQIHREEVVENVGPISSEPKKNAFIEGCLKLEKELRSKDPGIVLKKIWLTIPKASKKGKGGEYESWLETEFKRGINKIISVKI